MLQNATENVYLITEDTQKLGKCLTHSNLSNLVIDKLDFLLKTTI
jgi:hypothetical protein